MTRLVNLTLIFVTALICLGVYRIAEEARVTALELRETRAAIVQENQSMTVLGAEWARLTQPSRIQALAEKHLKLSDKPTAQVASVTQLPPKFLPQTEPPIRNANMFAPQVSSIRPLSGVATVSLHDRDAAPVLTPVHTGT